MFLSKRKIWFLVIFILFPVIPRILAALNESFGMVWIFMDVIYYMPIATIVGEPMFYKTEVGLLPEFWGRILAAVIYCIIFLAVFRGYYFFKSKSN